MPKSESVQRSETSDAPEEPSETPNGKSRRHQSAHSWRRPFLGICSILLIGAAILLLLQDSQTGSTRVTAGGCMRIGMLLGAIWLAWPQAAEITQNVPAWVGWALLGSFVIVVSRPRLIIFVGPLLLALLALHWAGKFIKPKPRKRG